MDGKPADEDQEKKVEAEEATKRAAALDELEKAIDSGEYKEPIDMLKWLKSQETTPPSLKLAIEKQLGWYKLTDEEDEEDEGDEEARRGREAMGDEDFGDKRHDDESDFMDDAARERDRRREAGEQA
jgi:hypothetical protein